MKKTLKKIFNVSTIGLLFQAFVPLTNTQNVGPSLSGMFTSNNLAGFFNAVFTTALSIGAILAVLRLAYAGWLYMGSADMWGSKSKAKEVIRDSIIGLLLLFGIYIILDQINPNILNLNILQNISAGSTPAATTPAGSTAGSTGTGASGAGGGGGGGSGF